ncbi:MAG TPA: hypothetical protein VHG89_01235 [Verrucomicrobiae bacterium]|nr:hypothetical protein [Verrucomicrobiae bacterium]
MKSPEKSNRLLRAPKLTTLRIVFALAVAIAADTLQFFSGFFGWVGFDQVIDFAAMILISWLIGFHILLLPTFVIELIPVLEDLPTWTACVIVVIILRRREQRTLPPPEKSPIEI